MLVGEFMKIKVITLGGKVNSYESEALLEQFKSNGYDVALKDECADVVVINTCSVTSVADGKSRQHIRSAIKENPVAIVASYASQFTPAAAPDAAAGPAPIEALPAQTADKSHRW